MPILPSQRSRASDLLGIRKISTTITWLDQHNSLLHPNLILTQVSIVTALNLGANGDYQRKTQPATMQRSTYCGEPHTSIHICITVPRAGGIVAAKRLLKPEHQGICCETVPPRNGCTSKTGPTVVSMSMLTRMGKTSRGSTQDIEAQVTSLNILKENYIESHFHCSQCVSSIPDVCLGFVLI